MLYLIVCATNIRILFEITIRKTKYFQGKLHFLGTGRPITPGRNRRSFSLMFHKVCFFKSASVTLSCQHGATCRAGSVWRPIGNAFPNQNIREKGLQGGVMAGDGCRFDGLAGGGLGRLKNRKIRISVGGFGRLFYFFTMLYLLCG